MNETKGTLFFMDGTKLKLSWPRQSGVESSNLASQVQSAFESDKLLAEVDGNLLVIPLRNIKYIQVTPTPEKIPGLVLRGARIID